MDARPIFFDHVQKSGGTAIADALTLAIGEPVIHSSDTENALPYIQRNINRRFIAGHFWYGDGDGPNIFSLCRCFTVIREPIDRAVSQFYFWKGNANAFQNEQVYTVSQMSFEEYVHSTDQSVQSGFTNFQTQHFYHLTNTGHDGDVSLREKLRLAKSALDRFTLVGVYEQLANSYYLMCHLSGIRDFPDLPFSNVTRARPKASEVDRSLVKRLLLLNEADVELHEYARQLFDRSMKLCFISLPAIASNKRQAADSTDEPFQGAAAQLSQPLPTSPMDFGSKEILLTSAGVTGAISLGSALLTSEVACVYIYFSSKLAARDVTVGIHISNESGQTIFGTNTHLTIGSIEVEKDQDYVVEFTFRCDLGIGTYKIGAAVHTGATHLEKCFHWRDEMVQFSVVGNLGYHHVGSIKLYPTVAVAKSTDMGLEYLRPPEDSRPQLLSLCNEPISNVAGYIRVSEGSSASHFLSGRNYSMRVAIKNTGSSLWPSAGRNAVYISYHWYALDGAPLQYEGMRTPLTMDVSPGEEISATFIARMPLVSGRATLQVTLLQESIGWFEESSTFSADRLDVMIDKS